MNPRILNVHILDNYRLVLTFNNQERKVFDVKPYLSTGIFKELLKTEIFNSVKVVDGTIQWSNEADFCPDTLYLEGQNI